MLHHFKFKINNQQISRNNKVITRSLQRLFPNIKNVVVYSKRDFETENNVLIPLDITGEPIYNYFVEFDSPDEYIDNLCNIGCEMIY